MDVRDMKVVGDASFDAVIDKGRLFDYFHCCVFHVITLFGCFVCVCVFFRNLRLYFGE